MILKISKSRNMIHMISRLAFIFLFIWFLADYILDLPITIEILSIRVLIYSIICFALLFLNEYIYKSGLLVIFFSYTIVIANGFVIASYLDDSYKSFQSVTSMAFQYNDFYTRAILIANIVIGAFIISTEIHSKDALPYNNIVISRNEEYEGRKAVSYIACILLAIGALYFLYFVFSHGLFFAGYAKALDSIEGAGPFQHLVVLTSLSVAFLFSLGTERGIKVGIFLYIIIAILQFSMGNRGEVMYATVVCFALYSIRFRKIKMKHVIIVVAAFIVLIPLIRVVRDLKFGIYQFNPFSSVLDVLAEEGIEISPFTYIVEYQNRNGYVWGMTYVYNFADFICRRIAIDNPFSAEKYIIKSIMPYEGMAFSMIAELYYNFTFFGASIIYFLFARLFKKVDYKIISNSISETSRLFIALLSVELINLSRNDSSTLPLYLAYIIIFWIIFSVVNRKNN